MLIVRSKAGLTVPSTNDMKGAAQRTVPSLSGPIVTPSSASCGGTGLHCRRKGGVVGPRDLAFPLRNDLAGLNVDELRKDVKAIGVFYLDYLEVEQPARRIQRPLLRPTDFAEPCGCARGGKNPVAAAQQKADVPRAALAGFGLCAVLHLGGAEIVAQREIRRWRCQSTRRQKGAGGGVLTREIVPLTVKDTIDGLVFGAFHKAQLHAALHSHAVAKGIHPAVDQARGQRVEPEDTGGPAPRQRAVPARCGRADNVHAHVLPRNRDPITAVIGQIDRAFVAVAWIDLNHAACRHDHVAGNCLIAPLAG